MHADKLHSAHELRGHFCLAALPAGSLRQPLHSDQKAHRPTRTRNFQEPMTDLAAPPKPAPVAKETKAQKAERLKLAKNPWEAWDEVRQFAREGRSAVLPEWAEFYFKWWGVYTQGDGLGVTG